MVPLYQRGGLSRVLVSLCHIRAPLFLRRPPRLPQDCCTLAVVLWGEAPTAAAERAHGQLVATSFDQLMERGAQRRADGWQRATPQRGDLASLAFTSGTSGKPKVWAALLGMAPG